MRYILEIFEKDDKFELRGIGARIEGNSLVEIFSKLPLMTIQLLIKEHEKEIFKLTDKDIPF